MEGPLLSIMKEPVLSLVAVWITTTAEYPEVLEPIQTFARVRVMVIHFSVPWGLSPVA